MPSILFMLRSASGWILGSLNLVLSLSIGEFLRAGDFERALLGNWLMFVVGKWPPTCRASPTGNAITFPAT